MASVYCQPEQLGFISIDGNDVPIVVDFHDSQNLNLAIDGGACYSGTVDGAASGQTLAYWLYATESVVADTDIPGIPDGTAGGSILVETTASGAGLAISFGGTKSTHQPSGEVSLGANYGFTGAMNTVAGCPLRLSPGDRLYWSSTGPISITRTGVGIVADTAYRRVGATGAFAVSNTVLRVLGATNWTGATTNGISERTVVITNTETGLDAYGTLITNAASLTGAVSSTDFEFLFPRGGVPIEVFVPAGYDIAIVKGSATANGTVRAREWLRG